MRNLASFPLLLVFLSLSQPSLGASLFGNEFGSGDMTPGYRCEVHAESGSNLFPVLNYTLTCTEEISDTKARELIGVTLVDFYRVGSAAFSVLDKRQPTSSNCCPPKVRWTFVIGPPGFSVII
jgi:hypothetical protein